MTDFASEFQKVFSNSCPPTTDWSKPRPFDGINNECYQAEAALMSSLTSEAYNQFGFEVQYFIKKSSTEKDKLYGEDTLENFERRFRLKVYAENVPQLQRSYQLQGMAYTEIVTLQATIEHFREASTYDWVTREPAWEEYYPKIGDVMYFPWCDLYYEVLNVKEFAEGTAFLSTPITFTFQLRVWRNAHESVDHVDVNDDKMEHLRSYVELSETFDINHKTIMNSRTFGHVISKKREISDAIIYFAQACATQLRQENSTAQSVMVYVRGDHFRQDLPFYHNSCTIRMPRPTASAMEIAKHALTAFNSIFREGFQYRKAGVMVSEIKSASVHQLDIFNGQDDVKHSRLMNAIDEINKRYGTKKIMLAPTITKGEWAPHQNHLSGGSKTLKFYSGMNPQSTLECTVAKAIEKEEWQDFAQDD